MFLPHEAYSLPVFFPLAFDTAGLFVSLARVDILLSARSETILVDAEQEKKTNWQLQNSYYPQKTRGNDAPDQPISPI